MSHKSIHMKNQNAHKKLILRKVSGDALLLYTHNQLHSKYHSKTLLSFMSIFVFMQSIQLSIRTTN